MDAAIIVLVILFCSLRKYFCNEILNYKAALIVINGFLSSRGKFLSVYDHFLSLTLFLPNPSLSLSFCLSVALFLALSHSLFSLSLSLAFFVLDPL